LDRPRSIVDRDAGVGVATAGGIGGV
jgi:hypothetical protein